MFLASVVTVYFLTNCPFIRFRFVFRAVLKPLSDYLVKPALVFVHNSFLIPLCGLCYNLNLLFTHCIYPCCKMFSYISCPTKRDLYNSYNLLQRGDGFNHYEQLDLEEKMEGGGGKQRPLLTD